MLHFYATFLSPDGVERWDGSWFINVGMEIDKIGTVIGWRLIKQKSL